MTKIIFVKDILKAMILKDFAPLQQTIHVGYFTEDWMLWILLSVKQHREGKR